MCGPCAECEGVLEGLRRKRWLRWCFFMLANVGEEDTCLLVCWQIEICWLVIETMRRKSEGCGADGAVVEECT